MNKRVLRIATLLFAVGVLTALTVHAGVTSGCASQTQNPATKTAPALGNGGAGATTSTNPTATINVEQPRFLGATKAAPVLLPRRQTLPTPANQAQQQQQAAPQQPAP